jgi:uncharacterized protein (TIGR01777 family)
MTTAHTPTSPGSRRRDATLPTSSLGIAITGATGTIGSHLARALEAGGNRVVTLVRTEPTREGEVRWDPSEGTVDTSGLESLDALVHLAGRRIDVRWTRRRRDEIVASRIESTKLLAQTLARLERPPKAFVSASAVGYYGNRGDAVLTEASDAGTGFLAELCSAWEHAAAPAAAAGIRVVNPRFGVVLTKDATPLSRLVIPFKLGLGATIGDGRQFMSWVHIDDAVAAIERLVVDDRHEGPVNVTAPEPITNRDLTTALGRTLGRPTFLRAPRFAVAAALGEMGRETMLASQRALPARLSAAGFSFTHPDLEAALAHELGKE